MADKLKINLNLPLIEEEIEDYHRNAKPSFRSKKKQQVEHMSSTSNSAEEGIISSHITSTLLPSTSQTLKRKRSSLGIQALDSEVIALSPNTLMATNRFVCEICNRGPQREQNLQLHNFPWNLKPRNKEEVTKKKVYVCPEENCVHHCGTPNINPS